MRAGTRSSTSTETYRFTTAQGLQPSLSTVQKNIFSDPILNN